jgi:hypothetical protein
MQIYGLDLGALTDEEYMAATDADDYVLRPLRKAASEVSDVLMQVEDAGIDNATLRRYAVTQVDALIEGLKDILEHLGG